ncbi:SCO-spondin-like [Octopus vulgaris]|uniref:SCO-spondin-like n=1 Tax=Octopus vulgaris TaxID=6645 RepID=A0AA36BYT5_OCTVU|nr:SCO-spondin-like [Octopus vulgaris]
MRRCSPSLLFWGSVLLLYIAATPNLPLASAKKWLSHICENTIKIEKSTTAKCSEFYTKVLEGYFLNRTASELTKVTTSELQRKLLQWQKLPASSPLCVFTKHELKKTESCCDGFEGDKCEIPVCYPPCRNGGTCDEPNECTCRSDFGGYRCEDRISDVSHSMGYCYSGSHCFGEKAKHKQNIVYTYADCCQGNAASSWGLTNSKCIACEITGNSTAKDVVKKAHALPFATCRNFGPYSYRTFDGVLYDFSGNCKYTLAVKPGLWSIDLTIQNCSRLETCKKCIPTERFPRQCINKFQEQTAIRMCSSIKSHKFVRCHMKVNVNHWFDLCVNYVCNADINADEALQAGICRIFSAYALECSNEGVIVQWRTQELCPNQNLH